MKATILLLFTLVATTSYGASITVSNNPDHPAQYTSLQAAYDAATDGDTIYVQGSNTSYGTITISKKVVLIGAGPNPSTRMNLKSKLGDLILSRDNSGNPSGTVIMGFELGRIRINSSNLSIVGIIIQRNVFDGLCHGASCGVGPASSWLIQHNVIRGGLTFSGSFTADGLWSNFIIRNNIFVNAILSEFDTSSTLFDHNVFIGTVAPFNAWLKTEYSTFTNNIFYWTGAGTLMGTGGGKFCIYNNNLSNLSAIGNSEYSPTDDFVNTKTGGGGNTGGGNLIGVSPDFTSAPSFAFADTFDFRLKDESIAKNAGTDGTDLGIYGGSSPWPDYSGGESNPHPAIPQLLSVDILNSTVPVNGTLIINVKAKSQN